MTTTLAWFSLEVVGLVAVAAAFGGMLFFTALYAPLAFATLPRDTAGAFLRAVFPRYYLATSAAAVVALAALSFGAQAHKLDAALLAAVAVAGLVARRKLLPSIDAVRDRAHSGDADAERRFRRLHGAAVALNGGQLLAMAFVLVHLAATGMP